MSVRQNILLSNANKSVLYDLNNDIQFNFPSSLFFKAPSAMEMLNFDLKFEIAILGNTNNVITVMYDVEGVEYVEDISLDYTQNIKTDFDITQVLKQALNSHDYHGKTYVFDVTESSIINVVTNPKIEVDLSTTSYSIKVNKPITISFEHKDSIGSLIGFGSGVYKNVAEISGTSTQSITAYNYIESINVSGNNGQYPNYDDLNCKMCMYDANGAYIPNKLDPNDATVSIHPQDGLVRYDNIGALLREVENAMNEYANVFTPAADFDVIYDYTTNKVTISNKTGSRFGIGFNCSRETGNVTSGSLATVLGFEQRAYTNNVSFVSPKESLSFENLFADDYILVCSNLSNNSNDLNIIGIGSNNNIKSNDILFAIPMSKTSSFEPRDTSLYRAKLSSSPFSIGYKNKSFNDSNPNLVNFYLRTLSGRHITAACQWTAMISFIF
jgi:hypothetical protein